MKKVEKGVDILRKACIIINCAWRKGAKNKISKGFTVNVLKEKH